MDFNFIKKLFGKGAPEAAPTNLTIGGDAPEFTEDSGKPEPTVYCKCLTTFLDHRIRYEAGEVCKFTESDAARFGSHGWVSAPMTLGDSNG